MRLKCLLVVLFFSAHLCEAATDPGPIPLAEPFHPTILQRHASSSPRLPSGEVVSVNFDYSYELLAGSDFSAVNRALLSKVWPEGSLAKAMRRWKESFDFEKSSQYIGWGSYDLSERIGYVSKGGVSFSVEIEEYFGQAHPSHEVHAYWVDLSGNFHSMNKVIGRARLGRIAPLAEAAFRREEQLTSNESLSNQGLFEPSNKFALPREILIEGPRKLLLMYNDYEIGPYAAGSPRVYVAW